MLKKEKKRVYVDTSILLLKDLIIRDVNWMIIYQNRDVDMSILLLKGLLIRDVNCRILSEQIVDTRLLLLLLRVV